MIVPYIDDDDVHCRAELFLRTYHPSYSCPVPIEEIAEAGLDLFILPSKELERACEVDGSISKDFKTILIDEYVYMKQEIRARFTIAHEVGHLILHKKLFEENRKTGSVEDFVAFQNSLSFRDWQRLEIQAYRFGEEILFPKKRFIEVVENELVRLGGLDSLTITDLQTLGDTIKKVFFVSSSASLNKLRREFPLIVEKAQSNIPF